MITLLTGENSFEIDRELDRIVSQFDGNVEKIDGSELELAHLPDLLMGQSLFADKRLVVIKNLSENKSVWATIGEWLERISDDIHVVFVEQNVDKRTKSFKELQRQGHVKDHRQWDEKDWQLAEMWAVKEAERLGAQLDKKVAHALVQRVGVDQWRLFHALEKLAVLDEVNEMIIEQIVEIHPSENIFQLFETALKSEPEKVKQMVQTLELTQDPYQVFGLLSGQAFQLAVLCSTDKPSGEVAKEIGAHPFVLQKLTPFVAKLGKSGAKEMIGAMSEADAAMKSSAASPWLLIERALLKIAKI